MSEQSASVQPAAEQAPQAVQTGRGARVLIVEDDQAAGRALAAILRAEGYQVIWAKTVAEGVAALAADPHFILLDLMLPDGSGREVAEQARARGLSSKVVVITGAGESVIEQVLDLRPQLVLRKPLQADGLLRWLSHLDG